LKYNNNNNNNNNNNDDDDKYVTRELYKKMWGELYQPYIPNLSPNKPLIII
jgi:hypothetical protein